ncbi:MAG: transcriptional repressor [Bacteroidia bacterium]|nr:transcriptional repressor [Bacteroidia bacterium]
MKDPIKEKLQHQGLRCTTPRKCIIQALQKGPKTHAEILKETRLDRVTTYRNLIALQKAGLVYRVYLPGRNALYVLCQAEKPSHAHFFCQRCSKGICLSPEIIQLASPWDTRVEKMLLLGYCPQCS